jgi:hypothetical protein
MRPPPRSYHPVSDLSRVVKIPALRCTASQDIKAKPTRSLSYKGALISCRGARGRFSLAALHCAARSIHRVT